MVIRDTGSRHPTRRPSSPSETLQPGYQGAQRAEPALSRAPFDGVPPLADNLAMMHDSTPPLPQDFPVTCTVQVRFRDLDAMNHVNNAVYLTYFEVGRGAYLKALLGPDVTLRSLGEQLPFILLDVYCRYVSPAELGEVLEISVRTCKVGTKSFAFEYLIRATDDGRTVAVGHSTQVYYDYANRCTAPVPETLREAIERVEGR